MGWPGLLEVTRTTGVGAPRGSHTGPVWQTGCKRAASEEHMSGMWVTGYSRLGPHCAPVRTVEERSDSFRRALNCSARCLAHRRRHKRTDH